MKVYLGLGLEVLHVGIGNLLVETGPKAKLEIAVFHPDLENEKRNLENVVKAVTEAGIMKLSLLRELYMTYKTKMLELTKRMVITVTVIMNKC